VSVGSVQNSKKKDEMLQEEADLKPISAPLAANTTGILKASLIFMLFSSLSLCRCVKYLCLCICICVFVSAILFDCFHSHPSVCVCVGVTFAGKYIFAWEVAQGHGLAQLNLTRLAIAFAFAFRPAVSSACSSFFTHIFFAFIFRTVCSFAAWLFIYYLLLAKIVLALQTEKRLATVEPKP